MNAADLTTLVTAFDATGDELAAKSRELVLMLLRHGTDPFSRDHFTPGHITGTAVVVAPDGECFALVHHARLDRWLLPGGHVEADDASVSDGARREAIEETGALLDAAPGQLVGIDVHGIPAKRGEPYHLHHDLIFAFRATADTLVVSEESHDVRWARLAESERYGLAESIVRAVSRARCA